MIKKQRKISLKKQLVNQAKNIDGISPKDKKFLRTKIREVWSWSTPHRMVVRRCLLPNGFSKCENPECLKKCPKVFVDHIKNVGEVDEGFITRMFVSSSKLQGLCKKCHDKKTLAEDKERRARLKNELDFY